MDSQASVTDTVQLYVAKCNLGKVKLQAKLRQTRPPAWIRQSVSHSKALYGHLPSVELKQCFNLQTMFIRKWLKASNEDGKNVRAGTQGSLKSGLSC